MLPIFTSLWTAFMTASLLVVISRKVANAAPPPEKPEPVFPPPQLPMPLPEPATPAVPIRPPTGAVTPENVSLDLPQYPPGSAEQIALFRLAARQVGLPEAWASDPGLINILCRESGGWVGIPNYCYSAPPSDAYHYPTETLRVSNCGGVGTRSFTNAQRKYWPVIWEYLRAGKYTVHCKAAGSTGLWCSASGLGQMTLTNINNMNYYPGATAAERRQGIGHALPEAIGMLRYIKDRYGTPAKAWAQYGVGHEGY